MSEPEKITVLYVDDEVHNLNSFRATFRKDFNVLTAQSAFKGLEVMAASEVPVHVVITDQKMPGMTGVDLLIKVMEEHPLTMRILLTGFTDIGAIVEALGKGQVHYRMEKPWDEDQVRAVIYASCMS
jgi:response regulator RpfG family c-di-GMP phosphodiesterase